MEGTAPLVATFIAVILLVLYGSYLFSKFVATRSGVINRSKGMRILDRIPVAKDSSIAVAKVGGRFFLIGISPSSISFITELSEEDVPVSGDEKPPAFKKAFYEKYIGIFKK